MSYRLVGEETTRSTTYRIYRCAHCRALLVATMFDVVPKRCAKCKA